MKNVKKKKAFSLIELLVVIVIIGILATLIILNIASARGKANDAKVYSNMSSAQRNIAMCLANGNTPTNLPIGWINGQPGPLPPGGTEWENKIICPTDPTVKMPSINATLKGSNGKYWMYGGSSAENEFLGYFNYNKAFRFKAYLYADVFDAFVDIPYSEVKAWADENSKDVPYMRCSESGCVKGNVPYAGKGVS